MVNNSTKKTGAKFLRLCCFTFFKEQELLAVSILDKTFNTKFLLI